MGSSTRDEMRQTSLNDTLNKLHTMELIRSKLLPPSLWHWVRDLGLVVRVWGDERTNGWRIKAGGQLRSYVDAARVGSEEPWRINKFDERVWNHRFERLVKPTVQIANYVFDQTVKPLPEGLDHESSAILKRAIKRYKATGEWTNLPLQPELLRSKRMAELSVRTALEEDYRDCIEAMDRIERRVSGDPTAMFGAWDAIYGQKFQGLAFRLQKFKEMEHHARRILKAKETDRRIPECFQWINYSDLGMLYFAALSLEVRNRGIEMWERMESDVSGADLGYTNQELRQLAVDHLGKALRLYNQMSSSMADPVPITMRLAWKASETLSVESFKDFDEHFEKQILGR